MSDLQGVTEAAIRVPLRSVPAPRVAIRETETRQAIEPILDETANLEDFHAAFLAAFGTTEQIIAEALFEQLVNALHADPTKALDAATANLVLALLHRIGPRDELEAMLAAVNHVNPSGSAGSRRHEPPIAAVPEPVAGRYVSHLRCAMGAAASTAGNRQGHPKASTRSISTRRTTSTRRARSPPSRTG